MGKENNSHNIERAKMFIEALRDFILPIVDIRGTEEHLNDENDVHIPSEAWALIDALEKFVAAVVDPKLNGKNTINYDGYPISADPELNEDSLAPISKDNVLPEKPALLKLALERARQRVFNLMPIRLLAFKKDGSGIELMERSVVWEHISATMEAEFDEEKESKEIQDEAIQQRRKIASLSMPDQIRAKAVAEENATENAITNFVSLHTQYAILSHTWLRDSPGEVTYAEWKSRQFEKSSPGYQKLANFCRIAATIHNVTFGWMDTICINKDSSSELDESIRSMYKWYSDATICIAYLAQTSVVSDMRNDAWLTRGWTLQELLAPKIIKFYSASWKQFVLSSNDKYAPSIQEEITAATTITGAELTEFEPPLLTSWGRRDYTSISRRMQWAANRHVTREEDTSYSLMGIFGVSISIAYGEGSDRAFFRLVKEILTSSGGAVLDVVNWGSGPRPLPSTGVHSSALIPSSPEQYLACTTQEIYWPRLISPITLTHVGLHLPVLLMPAITVDRNSPEAPFVPIGSYYSKVQLCRTGIGHSLSSTMNQFTFNVLDQDTSIRGIQTPRHYIVLAVLNFTEYGTTIELVSSLRCFAVALNLQSPNDISTLGAVPKLLTEEAVAFELQRIKATDHRTIQKKNLRRHGMVLRTMYL